MEKVKKGVILAAGLGTRVLPATKSMAKEMLPIVDKPAIQYIVEEMVSSGITDILIVLSRGKSLVQDHFDRVPELEASLERSGKTEQLEQIVKIAEIANIQYVRQQQTLGTGYATMYAKSFVGNDPFVVAYGDDVIIGEDPATAQVCRAYEQFGTGGALAIKEVSTELVMKYSSLKVDNIQNNIYKVSDMIEKPKENEILSHFAILGRCVLPASVFDILEKIPKGAGGEYQLTDAMCILARTQGMLGVDFTGTRYDMGNKFGIMKASIEVGLKHPEIKDELSEYIKEIAKTL